MQKEKVIYKTEKDLEAALKGKSDEEKKSLLKTLYQDKDHQKLRKFIVKEFVNVVRKSPVESYEIVYDSLTEGLEPIYYWILDFMRDSSPGGLGLDVFKGPENFDASVTSGYFGEIGQRASLMQQKAGEYLGAINQVIKSILNLLYDLREFNLRIEMYDQLKLQDPKKVEKGRYSLKALWMDTVDSRKGRGSINFLAQDPQFYTLRDAFFYVDDSVAAKKVELVELNDRVKRILKIKLEDFEEWVKDSERELRKRTNVEKAYLKSQVGSLKLYAGWVKPYLKAAQKLKMKEFDTPDIVNSFSNIEIQLSVLGQKEIKLNPASVHESFKDIELKRKFYAVVEVEMDFRGVPSAVTTQGGRQYVHGGRADIKFKAYALDGLELEMLRKRELYEDMDLVDEWVDVSLKEVQAELDSYDQDIVKEEPKQQAPKAPMIDWPFKGTIQGAKQLFGPLVSSFSFLKREMPVELIEADLANTTKEQAQRTVTILYTLYKKSHGMIAL